MSSGEEIGLVSVKNCKLEWKIDNFFSYNEEDLQLNSPDFLVLNTMWYIQICPNGSTRHNSKGCVSLYMYRKDDKDPQTVEYRLGIKNVNNTVECELIDVATISTSGWGYHKFIKRSDLLQRKSELVPSDILTVTCTIMMKNNTSDLDSSKYKIGII